MKSKTSFFNVSVFKKNITLYWPIWISYLLYLLIKIPGRMWMEFGNVGRDRKSEFACLYNCLNLKVDILTIAIAALMCGMALFGYLFKSESANMMHALPIGRKVLYITNVVSGLCFMIVPQIIVFLVTVITAVANGITHVQFIGMWFFSVAGISFFMYSVVSLCAMFTGQLFALPVYYGVLNYLVLGVLAGVHKILSSMGYGIRFVNQSDIVFLRVLSPINYLCNNVRVRAVRDSLKTGEMYISSLHYVGIKVVTGYIVAGLVMYLLAWYAYKMRRIESTGDILTFSWVKPLFCMGVGICTGYAAGILLNFTFDTFSVWLSQYLILLCVLVFGILGYLVAEMLIKKSFRVFSGKQFKEGIVLVLVLSASYGGFYAVAHHMEQLIPKEEDIQQSFLEMDYPVEYSGQELKELFSLHRDIIKNAKYFQKHKGDTDKTCVVINYHYKNGKTAYRSYDIPTHTKRGKGIIKKIVKNESKESRFLRYVMEYDYEKVNDFTGVQINFYNKDMEPVSDNKDDRVAKALFDAVRKDLKAGTLQKYNQQSSMDLSDDLYLENPTAYLVIDYKHSSKDWEDVYKRENESGVNGAYDILEKEEYVSDGVLFLNFGEDCKNIINALVEQKILKDTSDILFCEEQSYG